MKNIIISAIALLGLTSCNSFNTTTTQFLDLNNATGYTQNANKTPSLPYDETPEPRPIDNRDQALLCPPFVMPIMVEAPPLPLEELKRIAPNNYKKLDELQQQHIEDVRRYSILLKRTIANAHARYLVECRLATVNKHLPPPSNSVGN